MGCMMIVIDLILINLRNINFFLGKCASLYTRRETSVENTHTPITQLQQLSTHGRLILLVLPPAPPPPDSLSFHHGFHSQKEVYSPAPPPPPVELLCCAQMTCHTFTLKSSQVPVILTALSQESSDRPGQRNRKLG